MKRVKVETEDLDELIMAVQGDPESREICLLKELVPGPTNIGDTFLRLDFAETTSRPGYFMMTVNERGIQVTYMPYEIGDGKVVLDWKWKKPKKPKKRKAKK